MSVLFVVGSLNDMPPVIRRCEELVVSLAPGVIPASGILSSLGGACSEPRTRTSDPLQGPRLQERHRWQALEVCRPSHPQRFERDGTLAQGLLTLLAEGGQARRGRSLRLRLRPRDDGARAATGSGRAEAEVSARLLLRPSSSYARLLRVDGDGWIKALLLLAHYAPSKVMLTRSGYARLPSYQRWPTRVVAGSLRRRAQLSGSSKAPNFDRTCPGIVVLG